MPRLSKSRIMSSLQCLKRVHLEVKRKELAHVSKATEAAFAVGHKRSLAIHRLAFGQPRQEDLIEFLTNANSTCDEQTLRKLQLNLAP